MSAVYGIISYILIAGMLVGYVFVKRWGDQQEQKYNQFKDEQANNPNDPLRTWS